MSTRPLKEITFKDLGLSFDKHPLTNQPSVVKNENAISRSIKNLVLTSQYERLFQPFVFSDVKSSLFDNHDPITVQMIKTSIEDVIASYEPRAKLISVELVDRLELNAYEVTVTYMPLNTKSVVSVEMFLERIR